MKQKNRLWPALAVLVAIHGAALAAPWLAPYSPTAQHRLWPQAPPTPIHFFDAAGHFHPRPFVYPLVDDPERPGTYTEDRSRPRSLRFFLTRPAERRGQTSLHLVGVDAPAHLFLLGTDRLGRDRFSRLLHGARPSLAAGLLAGLLAVGLGLAIGLAAGLAGGFLDTVSMRGSELFLALPWLYLLLAARAFLPLDLDPQASFLALVVIIGAASWSAPARLVRAVALGARELPHVEAARGFGAPPLYLALRHVLPLTLPAVSTQLTLRVPRYIVAEVTLSFLGLGLAEPAPSWGNLLAELRSFDSGTPALAPALALAVVVLSYHRVSSALQRRPQP